MLRIIFLLFLWLASSPARAGLQAKAYGNTGHQHAIICAGKKPIFTGQGATPPLTLIHATDAGTARVPLEFATTSDDNGILTLAGSHVGGLHFQDTYRNLAPNLIERTVTVTAQADTRYYLDFGWHVAAVGSFHSFTGAEAQTASYSPGCSGPEFGGESLQTPDLPLSWLPCW